MKKLIYCILLLGLMLTFYTFSPQSNASSFNELAIGSPPDGAGELIATRGGWKLIEFWHYSGGYWKATTETENGLKEVIIRDSEATTSNWTNPDFFKKKSI